MTLLFERSGALPLVSIGVAVGAGAYFDPEGRSGVGRMTTRLLRRGTKKRTAEEIEDRIDALGGDFSADISLGATMLSMEVRSRDAEKAAEMIRELMLEPAFREDEFERLRRETLSEIVEARDSDRALASAAFRKVLFGGRPEGRRLGGTPTSVQAISTKDVEHTYQRIFHDVPRVVAISGDISQAEAEGISAIFCQKEAPRSTPRSSDAAHPALGPRLVIVDKADRTQTQLIVGTLGEEPQDPFHFPLMLANHVLGGMFSSRLMQTIRVLRGWSYGASSRMGLDHHREAFAMVTAPAAKDCADCLRVKLDMLRAWVAGGVTEQELDFAKKHLVRSRAFELDTPRKRVGERLDGMLLGLPADYTERYIERVQAVSLDEVQRAVAARIAPDQVVVSLVGTASELLPDLEKVLPWSDVSVFRPDFE